MGTAERKEREKLQRRQSIVDAAERVFFSKGYDNSSMDDVAKEAELSKGTLYLYFDSKEDLYGAIVRRGAFIQFYYEYPNYHDALMFDNGKATGAGCQWETEVHALDLKKDSNKIFIDAIREGIDDGSIRKDVNPVNMAMLLWGSAMGVLQLIKNKGPLLESLFNVKPEDIINEFMNNTNRNLSP